MKATMIPLVIGLVAVFVAFNAVHDRRAAQGELSALRERARLANERLARLEAENAVLRKHNAYLASQLPDPNDLAKLRADATELRRLRREVASTKPPSQTGKIASLPPAPQRANDEAKGNALTLDGTVRLDFGETVVSGGWHSATEGKRIFALMTPTRDQENGGGITLSAHFAEVPENMLETLGLKGLVTDAQAAERFTTFSHEQVVELLRAFDEAKDVDLLSSPRIVTRNGGEAVISIGNDADTEGVSIGFTPQVQPDGNGLDMTLKVRLPQPKAKTDQ